jgi:hypothetical protein
MTLINKVNSAREQLGEKGVSPTDELETAQRDMKRNERNWWEEAIAKSIGEGIRRGLAQEVREPLPSEMERALRQLRRQDQYPCVRKVVAPS